MKNLKGSVENCGGIVEVEYPVVKRWYPHLTYALFTSETSAIVISVDEAHEHDYVGKVVEDPESENWKTAKGFKITICG